MGWLWYLGTLVPVIGLIQIGVQGMADRYTYLTMIGIYVAVVWGAAELAARYDRLRVPLVAAAVVLLAAWTAVAAHQTATWKDSFTVFEHAIQVTPDNFFAAQSSRPCLSQKRGNGESRGRVQESGPDRAALRLGQRQPGRILRQPRRDRKAAAYFANASRINPYLGSFHANLGSVYLVQGKLKEAESEFRRAVKLESLNPAFRGSLCIALRRQGKIARGWPNSAS